MWQIFQQQIFKSKILKTNFLEIFRKKLLVGKRKFSEQIKRKKFCGEKKKEREREKNQEILLVKKETKNQKKSWTKQNFTVDTPVELIWVDFVNWKRRRKLKTCLHK